MEENELLIRQAINGQEEAFRKIVDTYKAYVFTICMNVLRDPHEAENAAQEVFLQIFRSLSKYEFKGFKTWIGRIAVNKSIDHKRRMKIKEDREVVFIDEIKNIVDTKPSIEEELISKYEKNRISLACDNLPERYSVIIKKFYMEEKSYKEIALEEDISIKTVESRLYRGRNLLKEKIKVDNNY